MPQYDGCYVNDIVHSKRAGIFQGITYNEQFKETHLVNEAVYPERGSKIEAFNGANNAIGSVFLKFASRKECEENLGLLADRIKVVIE